MDVIKLRLGKNMYAIRRFGPEDRFTSVLRDGYGDELYHFCRANLPHNAVVLDIGANIGLTACILSQLAARVVACEPGPTVFPLLEANISALGNVEAVEVAIGSEPGMVNFAGVSAYGHVNSDKGWPVVRVDTIDNIVEMMGLGRVDLIKIDVEGYEPHVLAGAKRTIERDNPIIYMEFNSWCLMDVAGVNPLEFARGLFQRFRSISVVEQRSGRLAPANDPRKLVHDNITVSRSVDDLVLLAADRPLNAVGV